MARKGWDNLSDAYRGRLLRSGIDKGSYDSGTPLHGARGKGSAQKESFARRTTRFGERMANTFPDVDAQEFRDLIRDMGRNRGNQFMYEQQQVIRAYERGDSAPGRDRYEKRDPNLPKEMFYYHGIFGF